MKKIMVLMMMVSSSAVAQNRSNTWIVGAWGLNSGYYTTAPGTKIDFSQGFADTIHILKDLAFFLTDASIGDTSGRLLFYTNDIYIADRNHDTLKNCEDFNPGYLTNYYGADGMGMTQASIVIPTPDNSNGYYLFHETAELVGNGGDNYPIHLAYSKIDMSLNNGLGAVVENQKNIFVVNDTLYKGQITACKHANGRDWWIVVKKYFSDKFYKVLVTPYSTSSSQQQLGSKVGIGTFDGMAVFSPDGSKYAFTHINDTIEYMNFNRCTGELSDYQVLTVPYTTSQLSVACSFSPNSRFFYVNTLLELFQYDTWAANIQNSVIKVAEWDTTDLWDSWFHQEQLASDGRIYLSTWNSMDAFKLYYIDQPDEAGVVCSFNNAGLSLNAPNNCVPNFPNYDLGPLNGSDCDTLSGIETLTSTSDFHFSPNPASSHINIVYAIQHNATLTITNSYRNVVKQLTLYPYFKNRIVYVDDLAEGMYLVSLKEGDKIYSGKMAVVR